MDSAEITAARDAARDRTNGEFGRQGHAESGIVDQPRTVGFEAGGLTAGKHLWLSPAVGRMQDRANKTLRHRLYQARLAGRFGTVVETFKTDDRDEAKAASMHGR